MHVLRYYISVLRNAQMKEVYELDCFYYSDIFLKRYRIFNDKRLIIIFKNLNLEQTHMVTEISPFMPELQ